MVEREEKEEGAKRMIDRRSDVDSALAFAEADELVKKWVSMPKETIVDLLVQASKVVTGYASMAVAMIERDVGASPQLPQEQLHDVEIETLAAIDTFKHACDIAVNALYQIREDLERRRP